jgi:cAMP-dependent protein kinase regulator
VINEGDDGNELFIVDEGFFKCAVANKKKSEKVYGPGEAFGELALLYNTKRASTIIAETDGKLYSLDRLDFNTILRENVLKKTEMCDRILSNIEIFQTLDRYEK